LRLFSASPPANKIECMAPKYERGEKQIEAREWLDSLEYVFSKGGPERVEELLQLLQIRAQQHGVTVLCPGNTPYIDTIPAEKQAPCPRSREIAHPWLAPEFWEYPSVSMGLAPILAIYQARFNHYLQDRGLEQTSKKKVWALIGDGEMDEPESMGAITLAAREELDNLIFVVNCNLQRLDGPVRGNGQVIQELEAAFEVPSPAAGEVVEIAVEEGDTVSVGQLLIKVETDDGLREQKGQAEGAGPEQADRARDPAETEAQREEKGKKKKEVKDREKAGREGVEKEEPSEKRVVAHEEPPDEEAAGHKEAAPASPSVRRLARELGIDIDRVSGSGPGGRIPDEDVKQAAKRVVEGRTQDRPAPTAPVSWAGSSRR
jgi:hypothetical protein